MNKLPDPPKRAMRFLRWFCCDDFLEEIEGDLVELFERQYADHPAKARRAFGWGVLRHFRPAFLRSFSLFSPYINVAMFRNYLIVAWRNMLNQKLFSFINIGGLALGLASFILISLFVQHELSYDDFFPDKERIYRVYQHQAGNEYLGSEYFALTPVGLATAMETQFPEVEVASSFQVRNGLVGLEKNTFQEQCVLAEPDFFKVMGFELVAGDANQVLDNAQHIVLTQSLAKKLFPAGDALGKTLMFENEPSYIVSGIMADPPGNSSLQFELVVSILGDRDYQLQLSRTKWQSNSVQTFFKLKPGKTVEGLETKFPALLDQYSGNDETYPFKDTYYAQSLADLHLAKGINMDVGLKGETQFVAIFSIIALLVLILACINYMNLAIARSISRAREVGLRKVVGAGKRQLITQFIGESIFTAFLALLGAVLLARLGAPMFSYLFDRPIAFTWSQSAWLLPGLISLVVLIGALSGSFPAFLIAKVEPNQALKGSSKSYFAHGLLQRVLVIGQYTASIALIICCIVMYQQFSFIQDKELGFQTEQVVTIPTSYRDGGLRENFGSLKAEWEANPRIQVVSNSSSLPTYIYSSTIINDEEGAPIDQHLAIYQAYVGYDFLKVYEIELLAGRNFSPEFGTDPQSGYIINETAARALGYDNPLEAIGQEFTDQGVETIIGVIKDFHMHDMSMEIQPLMLMLSDPSFIGNISVKVQAAGLAETLKFMESSFKAYSPFPFNYSFMDERFAELYAADKRAGELLGVFTMLALCIATLGLFGLAAVSTTQRTKEIGIRKVLGGSVHSILTLLSRDYLKMVMVGFVLATPLAWYLMNLWLRDYAYRIDLEWWFFGLAGIMAFLVALLTVGGLSFRAALGNPVDALRSE